MNFSKEPNNHKQSSKQNSRATEEPWVKSQHYQSTEGERLLDQGLLEADTVIILNQHKWLELVIQIVSNQQESKTMLTLTKVVLEAHNFLEWMMVKKKWNNSMTRIRNLVMKMMQDQESLKCKMN